jgi:hypothetical protein
MEGWRADENMTYRPSNIEKELAQLPADLQMGALQAMAAYRDSDEHKARLESLKTTVAEVAQSANNARAATVVELLERK